ncbi:MAG: ATPase [Ruminococcaceae bacterium]|jgi:sugar (pentulose or hexulose) kinase|nr:ATPase [Oscillospiraceae bacterium]
MNFKNTTLGLELGSTRIKAVLLDEDHRIAASGSHDWENRLENGIWTYTLDDIHEGVRDCIRALGEDVMEKFGEPLPAVGAVGISGMMHGYLAFDENGELLVPFRTWRNTITGEAADALTALLGFNIPQRWSIAHLAQAVLNGEEHIPRIHHLNTLAGYIHELLTGVRVLGVGEASGMFPIDSAAMTYDAGMMAKADEFLLSRGCPKKLAELLPSVLPAGEKAGELTEAGARFLDPTGELLPGLKAGVPFCPPEGDAGTGMAATDSVRLYTGNVSAGTSDFAMVVVDHLPGVHREIDMVTTPDGLPVAMVHCNNCTSDINAWIGLFGEFAKRAGLSISKPELYDLLLLSALEGDPDCGGLLSYNYFSGEGITDVNEGRPLFLRTPDAKFTLPNFMRTHLLSALATLKIGLDILTNTEKLRIDRLFGHGGYFKTEIAGQRMLSAAAGVPVSVMKTAESGGPYGMALLAAYMLRRDEGESLPDYLDNRVFAGAESTTLMASEEEIAGFDAFLKRYLAAFPAEKAAIETLR